MNISRSNISSLNWHLLALRISLPILNSLSTAALDGIGVLYLVKSFIKAGSPKKVASLRSFLESASSHDTNKLWALALSVLVEECPVSLELEPVMAAQKSSLSRSSLLESPAVPEHKNLLPNHKIKHIRRIRIILLDPDPHHTIDSDPEPVLKPTF